MTKKEPKQIFQKSLLACVLIIGFGIYLFLRGNKEKAQFDNVTGKIDYYDKTFGEINYRGKGNHRFIRIMEFPLIFDIFVGKASGDFGPNFEKLDNLKIGDEITIYYANKTLLQKKQDYRFNKSVQFIDKDGEAYFIRGNKDAYGGYFFIGIGVVIAIALVILKQTGRIE
ncbi:sortase family protein [Gelidibacter gilvus]|uniref:Uncharacterized protein n=1 Tax=Gelidibacter gilvus TaxID=59602 RepID=A0A4Q0XFK2_9FLAO|nr:hypothetical protein [Gelidibacter gilvus]RXJ45469.1 hypothetical protein ESZ48_15780 [Gelidibacter gilvus]